MKMLVVNGSPRKAGNSATLSKVFIDEVYRQVPHVDIIDVVLHKFHINGCLGCGACKHNGGTCIQKDDMQSLYPMFLRADTIVFVSPVYWWGITAQTKAFIDRLYKFTMEELHGKRVYVIVDGEDTTDGIQYDLIKRQFEEICSYCGMELAGYLPLSTPADNPAAGNPQALEAAKHLFKAR